MRSAQSTFTQNRIGLSRVSIRNGNKECGGIFQVFYMDYHSRAKPNAESWVDVAGR